MLYSVEEIAGGIRIVHYDGQPVAELRGGNVASIALTFANFARQSAPTADAYMAGVVDALCHGAMTGASTVARDLGSSTSASSES